MKSMQSSSRTSKRTLAVILACLLAPPIAVGHDRVSISPTQPQPSPIFDPPDSQAHISGRQINISGSLVSLIMAAYHVRDYQIVNVPEWVGDQARRQYYDIVITHAEGTPGPEQTQQMLETLLADRFRVKLHRETKEIRVYDLVVAEGGPKFRQASGVDCDPADPDNLCARELFGIGPLGVVNYTNMPLASLVLTLTGRLHYEVRDRTGVSGRVGYREKIFMKDPEEVSAELQKQLGLKLIPATESMEVLVIDHAEQP